MAFSAGEVFVLLGGQFNPAGFAAFDAAAKKSASTMAATEAAIATSSKRASAATGAMAGAFQDSAGRWRAASGRFLSDSEKVALGVESMGRRSSKASSEMEEKMKKAAKGGALALGAAIVGSVVAAARFESQMSAVQAVTKASESEMRRMTDAAKKLGAESGLGATKTAKAIEELAKGGLTTAQILGGGLKGAIDLALAGQLDLGVAAETTANALNLFGLKGADAAHVADALATAANATTADVGDFAQALAQGGGAAKAAGLSFDETIVALEALALSGVKGSDAGTSLKAALSQIAKPTKESAGEMKKLGLEFFDAEGKIRPLTAISKDLGDKLGGMSEQQRLATLQTIAGTDGFRALLALYDQGPAKLSKLAGGLDEQGTAATVAADKTDNAAGAWDRLKAAIENVAIDAGTPVLDGLKTGMDEAATAIEDFRQNVDLDSIKQELQTFFSDLGIDTGDLEQVRDVIGDVFDEMQQAGQGLGGGIFQAVSGGAALAAGAIGTVVNILQGDWRGAWESAKGAATGALDGVVGGMRAFVAPIASIVSPIAEAISGPFKTGVSTVLGLLSTMLDATASVVEKLAGVPVIGDKFDGLADGIRGAADGINGLRDQIKGVPKSIDVEVDTSAQDAIAALKGIEDTKLQRKVVRVLGEDTDATTKIRRLEALGIDPKTARVLADVGNALAGVNSVQGAMARLTSKQISVTVTTFLKTVGSPFKKKATGGGPGDGGLALVGEGKVPREYVADPASGSVMRVDEPTFMNLPDTAYVVPTDPSMRGRSLGLFADLARDLGVPGYAKGKKPAKKKPTKKKRNVPKATEIFRADPSDLERVADNATERLEDAKRASEDKDKKGRLTENARKAKGRIPALRAEANRRRQIARKAAAEAARITKQDELADIARNDMVLADQRDDQAAFDAAKGRRGKALGAAAELLKRALASAPKESAWARALAKRLGDASIQGGDNASSTMDVDAAPAAEESAADRAAREAAERLADTGMTDGERARLGELEAQKSLAALTAGLDDDKAAASGIEAFLSQILGFAQLDPARGGASSIKSLADQVKQARGELTALTGGGGQVDNQDLQAQIEQERERTRAAQAENAANIAALQAFGSPGDIGTGRFGSALGAAAGVTVNVNTLHPGDPRTRMAIAEATAAGIGLQNGSRNPVQKVGI